MRECFSDASIDSAQKDNMLDHLPHEISREVGKALWLP